MEEQSPYITPVLDNTPYRNKDNIFETNFRGMNTDTFNSYMLNRDLMERSQNFELDMWNRQNEYNSPQSQMERMIAAGISPAAAANSVLGSGSMAGAVGSASSPSVTSIPSGSEFEKIAGAIGTGASAFKDVNSALTSLIDNRTRGEMNELDLRMKRENIKNLKEIIKGNKKQNRLLDSEIDRFDRLTPVEVQKGYLEIDKMKEEISLIQKQQEVGQSQIELNNAETGLVIEQAGTEKYNKLIQQYRHTMITTFGFDKDSNIISLGVQAILNGHGEELLNGIQAFLTSTTGGAPDFFVNVLKSLLQGGKDTVVNFGDLISDFAKNNVPEVLLRLISKFASIK